MIPIAKVARRAGARRAYGELFEGYRIDPIRVLQPAARSRINMTARSF
jgi:hypothetical protein